MTLITYLTRVHFADGVLEEALWSELEASGKKRPLVLIDRQFARNETTERLYSGIPARTKAETFDDIPHIPTEQHARRVATTYADKQCDVLIAFGDARTIDLAKVARVAIAHDTNLSVFSYATGGSRRIGNSLPDLFAIPGISGFGSAVSAHAPLILQDGKRALIMCKKLIPGVTICDPMLTLCADTGETASSGADAITHCIEAYLSKSYNPPAEGIALDGLNRALHNLERALSDGSDIAARREMMAASLNGALALQKGLGASHAISSALEAVCDFPLDQGVLNRIALPGVLQFNQQVANEKYKGLLRLFASGKKRSLPEEMNHYFSKLPLSKRLSELGLNDVHLQAASTVAAHDLATDTNPRSINAADYLTIMRSVH